ncbi:uncharacterized protein LOC106167972 [Lingula anatina]|uniref:Uncharacterized protein LOC106167972 n=1 Tax=Lingula anatina TaxID=7574 RepID=A0A1S3IXR3_LINAN|nr:uncharacterized protein LOC106167972 [Lingula anatina]XP_013402339.1 uncharacterized protein LOC106167972 [Lingula anatina]XP_013402340.1 uncharacterized protein LOC106167972 [Lingula anatina]|eukprot:XP_013402338.1 uncharacterized protein LOC106167972 [Lingula anatina]
MKRAEPLITVRQNKRTSFKTMSQMSGDDIQTLKRTKKSEISHEALCYNVAANRALKKQLSQWHREHNIIVGNIKRGQHSVYKTMLRVNMDKKRLQYEAYKKEQEKYRVIMSQNKEKINLMVLDKLSHSDTSDPKGKGSKIVSLYTDAKGDPSSSTKPQSSKGHKEHENSVGLTLDLADSRGFYLSTSHGANIDSDTARCSNAETNTNTASPTKPTPCAVRDTTKINPLKIEDKDAVSVPNHPFSGSNDNVKSSSDFDGNSDTGKNRFERKTKVVEVTKDSTKPLVREKSEGEIQVKNKTSSSRLKLPPLNETVTHSLPNKGTTSKHDETDSKATKPDILKIGQKRCTLKTEPSLRKLSIIDESNESSLNGSVKNLNLISAASDTSPVLPMCEHRKNTKQVTSQQNDFQLLTSPSLSFSDRKHSVSSTSSNKDKKFSFVEYNKRKRKERERKVKEALSGLPPIYVKDEQGNVVPHHLEFRRAEFKLPTNAKKRQLQQLREAEMLHGNHIGDKLHDFHQKYIKEDDMRKQALREAAEQKKMEEPDPSKTEVKPTRMLGLGAAWSTALANTTAKFMKSDLDPNSSEGLQQCGYLRSFDVDLKYEMKAKGESYTKRSSWKSKAL